MNTVMNCVLSNLSYLWKAYYTKILHTKGEEFDNKLSDYQLL
jgi:hypothetical protein